MTPRAAAHLDVPKQRQHGVALQHPQRVVGREACGVALEERRGVGVRRHEEEAHGEHAQQPVELLWAEVDVEVAKAVNVAVVRSTR